MVHSVLRPRTTRLGPARQALPATDPWHTRALQWLEKHQPTGTVNSYATYWKQFETFCEKAHRCPLPASPATVHHFMRHLLRKGRARKTINNTTMAAIARKHRMLGLPSPTDHAVVRLTKRVVTSLTPDSKGKLPLTPTHLRSMTFMVDSSKFVHTRDLVMFILMFGGMLREDEAVKLKAVEVWIDVEPLTGEPFLNIWVDKSKTDQQRKGHHIVLAAQADPRLCPVAWYTRYLSMRDSTAVHLFHGSRATDSRTVPMGSTTACDRLKKWVAWLGLDPRLYGSHSCRRGGATSASAKGVSKRLIKRHGRWISDCVELYIVESLHSKLQVSQSIFLI